MKKLLIILPFMLLLANKLSYAQWQQTYGPNGGAPVYAFAVININIFAISTSGVYLSTNDGNTWNSILSGTQYSLIEANESNVICSDFRQVYLSTNYGSEWTTISSGLDSSIIHSLAMKNSTIYAGTYYNGIYRSTDTGKNWITVNNGFTVNSDIESIAIKDSIVFVGTFDQGNFRSTDNGESWSEINSGFPNKYGAASIVFNDLNIFMGNGRGVYRSTNNGTNWTIANNGIPDNSYAYRLAIKDSIIFAAVFGGGLYISTNNGSVWKDCAIGLPYKYAICLAINGSNVYAGTPTGVWRRSIQEILTDIREHEDNLPIRFSLYQNYPNPFNPKTRIDYAIPKGSNVIIKVYNSLGEEVETLINEYKAPGSYSINFDGSSLTSGVYFYQLRADKFTLTKKMVLLR